MKPTEWKDCPASVLETFLWDLELDYDPYEGSKEEVIHCATCGASISSTNEKIIGSCWKNLGEESFRQRCQTELESLERQVEELKGFV